MNPQRIVSLVPSLTELIAWLGAGQRLIGRTKFCTEPAELAARVEAVGGTKNPDVARIVALAPDLVIANREENRREDVEHLRAAGIAVLVTDPTSVLEATEMIRDLGARLAARDRAEVLAREIEDALGETPGRRRVPVYTGVWHNPMMGLGAGTYGHSLIEACGGQNVLAARQRYPEVTMDELLRLGPQLILLPDEPFPFDEGHAALYGKVAPVRLLDGKLLWWYGPRTPAAVHELRALFAEVAER